MTIVRCDGAEIFSLTGVGIPTRISLIHISFTRTQPINLSSSQDWFACFLRFALPCAGHLLERAVQRPNSFEDRFLCRFRCLSIFHLSDFLSRHAFDMHRLRRLVRKNAARHRQATPALTRGQCDQIHLQNAVATLRLHART